jgi:hypothetical protein
MVPSGLCMGMPLPLGMKLAAGTSARSTAWLWAANGATSVCGSVVAMILSLRFGISFVMWTGIVTYCGAALTYWRATQMGAVINAEVVAPPALTSPALQQSAIR